MQVPLKYLGIHVGDNNREKVFWNDMILEIKSKLTNWKGKHLSFARRVILIKYVIFVVPLYYLSLFKMPTTIGKLITRLQRDLFMGMGKR